MKKIKLFFVSSSVSTIIGGVIFGLAFILFSCASKESDYSPNSNYYPPSTPAYNIGGNSYNYVRENSFVNVAKQPISTFSIDADGASYANVRRHIQQYSVLPPRVAVRTEELINYFDLDYPFVSTTDPISLNGEISECPWNDKNKLMRIGIKGKPIPKESLPASNFVFLIDVSGSMATDDKLELLKKGFRYIADELLSKDRVAIVTYSGKASVALPSTSGDDKATIKRAIDGLSAGGGTAGGSGINTAYEIARQNFVEGGNNRVVLGTDGDFNVGITDQNQLVQLIKSKKDLGIYLTVLGVGFENLKEGELEQIANNGNGNFEYIDNIEQMRKVFIYDYSKFYTVAKDVKVQIRFNPDAVNSYRLIGYENRSLASKDFTNDSKDAGEIGSNQNITALYELVMNSDYLPNVTSNVFSVDCRYKKIGSEVSSLLELQIADTGTTFANSSDFMKFTASVASFSMLISYSSYKGTTSYDGIISWLEGVNLSDTHEFKAEFKKLVQTAKQLK